MTDETQIDASDFLLLCGNGPDTLYFSIGKPNGCWPYNDLARVKMEIAAGQGREYMAANFPDVTYRLVEV